MNIRCAEEADLPAIVSIYAEDDLRGSRESSNAPLPQEYLEAFREIAGDPNQRLYVAEFQGQILGTLQMTLIRHVIARGFRRAVLEALFVGSTHQGKGVGSALIAHARAEALACGCTALELTSNKLRTRAHGFYDRLGFTASHEGFKLPLR